MERTIRLHTADSETFTVVCPHITLGGMRRINEAELFGLRLQVDTWSIVCHECGDVFNIEYMNGD